MIKEQEKSFGTATLIIRFKEKGRPPRVYPSHLLITGLTTSVTSWIATGSGNNSLGTCSFILNFDLTSKWYKIEFTFGSGFKLSFDNYTGIQTSINENEINLNWQAEVPSIIPPHWSIQPTSQIQMLKSK